MIIQVLIYFFPRSLVCFDDRLIHCFSIGRCVYMYGLLSGLWSRPRERISLLFFFHMPLAFLRSFYLYRYLLVHLFPRYIYISVLRKRRFLTYIQFLSTCRWRRDILWVWYENALDFRRFIAPTAHSAFESRPESSINFIEWKKDFSELLPSFFRLAPAVVVALMFSLFYFLFADVFWPFVDVRRKVFFGLWLAVVPFWRGENKVSQSRSLCIELF